MINLNNELMHIDYASKRGNIKAKNILYYINNNILKITNNEISAIFFHTDSKCNHDITYKTKKGIVKLKGISTLSKKKILDVIAYEKNR